MFKSYLYNKNIKYYAHSYERTLDYIKQELINLSHQVNTVRNLSKIESEYNTDKYGSLLLTNVDNVEDCHEYVLNSIPSVKKVSLNQKLYNINTKLIYKEYNNYILEKISRLVCDSNLCELGCGYGYYLSHFKNSYGGEYTDNGVALAKRFGLDVCKFNYYNEVDYDIIRPNSVILTVASVEQLPSAKCFIDNLRRHKDKIKLVIQIEPTHLYNTIFSDLRKKYAQVHDYNTDLMSLLRSNDIELIEYEYDMFGYKPENTYNWHVWRFK